MILMILFALHEWIMSDDDDETYDEFVSCEESKTKKVSKIILSIQ